MEITFVFLAAIAVLMALAAKQQAHLNAERAALLEMTAQRDYWRDRAEKLTDAALVRAGAIHQPTMEDRKPVDRIGGAVKALTSALATQEIDTSKRKAVS